MTGLRLLSTAGISALLLTLSVGLDARQQTSPRPPDTPGAAAAPQAPRTSPAPSDPTSPTAVDDGRPQNPFVEGFPPDPYFNTSPILRIGQDYTVAAGAAVREVVVISGSVRIEGRVERDVVVVLGTAHLGPAAVVNGSLVAVAGAVVVEPGAQVFRDFVVVGGGVNAPASFVPGGEQVVIGANGLAEGVQAFMPWATRGLLLGRLIVPSLPWMWAVVSVVFFVYFVLNLLFERPIRASADILSARPLTTFLVGLLVLLLTGPVAFILIVSIVGIVVLPFALCALLIAWVLGKVAVSRAIGASILSEDEPGNKVQATRSFAIGFVLIAVAYMIPILGLATFILVAVFGLGSSSLALRAGLRRENPAKPKPPRPVPPPRVSSSVTSPLSHGVGLEPSVGTPVLAAEAPTAQTASVDDPGYGPAPETAASAGPAPMPPPVVPPGTLLAMPKGSLQARAAAFALDIILVLFVYSTVNLDNGARFFFFLLYVYHVAFWTMKGTTVGGIICNLRVIRTDGGAVGLSESLIRALASILSIITAGIGCLWIAYDPERQAWHDRIAGTYVVQVPRNWPV